MGFCAIADDFLGFCGVFCAVETRLGARFTFCFIREDVWPICCFGREGVLLTCCFGREGALFTLCFERDGALLICCLGRDGALLICCFGRDGVFCTERCFALFCPLFPTWPAFGPRFLPSFSGLAAASIGSKAMRKAIKAVKKVEKYFIGNLLSSPLEPGLFRANPASEETHLPPHADQAGTSSKT